ncbi:uracil-xanthine permease family protein [Micromonospora sp. C28ISP2-4]|uniref:uracil-xanthine permease family protein n=1 Tax=Micromonospora sp. C28ISP2-4 TaxID=3059523 RepID=UPI002676EA27|nr:solute carrier family 23 protein [Micromonospora sp. C28ISP2-4]MDO3685075.1 solute carrier family 23 protein [Micromonospora sp. C28ISP2-4]
MTQSPTSSRWSPWTLHGDGRHVRPGDVVQPDERLSWPRTVGVGVQHVVAMFGATFTVPLITGFPPATTLLFSGLDTLLFLLITGNRLPSYLGSSFAFIAPVLAAKTDGGIGAALGGIVVAGVALAIVGVVVQVAGSRWIDALMPPVVTGAIVMLIGLNLAPVAWDGDGSGTGVKAQPLIAVVTLVAILLTTVLFRGFVARLSILIGVAVGWALAALTGNLDQQAVSGLRQAAWVGFPEFHTPSFDARAVVLVIPVILVLIAENAGHVKAVAAMTGRNLDRDMGRALLGDGVATVLAGSGGGSGTTTYAENIGVMAATRVYSTAAYWIAGATAILLGLCPKFGALILTVPAGVLGGATTALYGLIAILGARIWIEGRVDFHDPINLFTAAVAVIIGAANYTLTAGDLSFNGIALGTAAALVIYHGMRLIARLRGTTPESRQSPEPEL